MQVLASKAVMKLPPACELRSLPGEISNRQIIGDTVIQLLLDQEVPKAIVIDDPRLAASERNLFKKVWDGLTEES